ncbi:MULTISPECIES: hypothetical protein [unclassified Curtobacterium]|uniref:hypothetical protein n=1 Tax=unclassified Curtobacterium TaxID=257496 RepID=UPI00381CFC0D
MGSEQENREGAADVAPPKRARAKQDHDWYRSVEWDADIAAAFEAKLARARSARGEYLRVQGSTLALQEGPHERLREVGRELLTRFMAETAASGAGPARVNSGGSALAQSFALSGRYAEAALEFRAVLRRIDEAGTSSYTSGAVEFELAEVLLHLGGRSSLAEADALLRAAEPEMRRTPFFRNRLVSYLTARARVARQLGDPDAASNYARAALDLIAIQSAPLPRHPGVGVPHVDATTRKELERLVAVRRRRRWPFGGLRNTGQPTSSPTPPTPS